MPSDVPEDTMKVTEAMHEAVVDAFVARVASAMRKYSSGMLDLPSRDDVEFIIAAVAPLIAAREREACIKHATDVAKAERDRLAGFVVLANGNHHKHAAVVIDGIVHAIRTRGNVDNSVAPPPG